jgi:hypothetical protein
MDRTLRWAVTEAVNRDAPIRLVRAVPDIKPLNPPRAHCPVAVIRSDCDGSPGDGGVISVVLDDEPDNDAVVHLAMHEGRLRNATVRQIDRRVDSWIRRYPDVPVEIVAAGTGRYYRSAGNHDVGVQLAVVGDSHADEIWALGVPDCRSIVGYPDCSVLIVRE